MPILKTKVYIASTAALTDTQICERLYATLPLWRQKRVDRAATAGDKARSLGAGLLLKTALAEQGVDIDKAEIGEENGKSYLVAEPHCRFSLSHSGDQVMCAVSPEPVGCDVQKMRALSHDVAKRHFTGEEYQRIMNEPTAQAQQYLFFRLWSLKESFLKATGRGLSMGMRSFSVATTKEIARTCSYDGQLYFFKEYKGLDGYCFACCGQWDAFEADMVAVTFSDM